MLNYFTFFLSVDLRLLIALTGQTAQDPDNPTPQPQGTSVKSNTSAICGLFQSYVEPDISTKRYFQFYVVGLD